MEHLIGTLLHHLDPFLALLDVTHSTAQLSRRIVARRVAELGIAKGIDFESVGLSLHISQRRFSGGGSR